MEGNVAVLAGHKSMNSLSGQVPLANRKFSNYKVLPPTIQVAQITLDIGRDARSTCTKLETRDA